MDLKSNMRGHFIIVASILFSFSFVTYVDAATLRVSPDTGVYTAGGTFTTQVIINTQGKPVNAADGQLTFNPKELSVVSVSRSSSIFNLWTEEPAFSNGAGTISFGGGSPNGYTGASGNVISITWRALVSGNPKVTFKGGSVLAADGMGTNVLTAMNGGMYTVSAKAETPEPEYIAPANTPAMPKITSNTHPDPDTWYKEKNAHLAWNLPSDVIAVRTLLDESGATIPTRVYEEPISSINLDDLREGVSYFHLQFKNDDGWGKVAHYRLAIDSEEPSAFTISELEQNDTTNPERTLLFSITDNSPIISYRVQIDGDEAVLLEGKEATTTYTLPRLGAGHHTVIVEASDSAKNTRVATYSFDIASFEAPVFTDYPLRMSTGVVPALRGTTRDGATVVVTVTDTDGTEKTYTTVSDPAGVFTFIPETAFAQGVYDITAHATDVYGAESSESHAIRIIVEEPGFIRIGSFIVSVLSVIVPLVALIFLLILSGGYLYQRLRVWRKKISKETSEVDERLRIEFDEIVTNLNARVAELKDSRKGKLTKAESQLIEQMELDIADARLKIRKEIADIENMIR